MDYQYDGEKVYPSYTDSLIGRVEITSDLRIKGKTIIITSLADESEIYYLPVLSWDVTHKSYCFLLLPRGNYIARIPGDPEEHYFSIVYGPCRIQWGI